MDGGNVRENCPKRISPRNMSRGTVLDNLWPFGQVTDNRLHSANETYMFTSLFEVMLHNAGDFLSALVRVGDLIEFFDVEEEGPWPVWAVMLQELVEVDVMSLAVQHVLPHAAAYIRPISSSISRSRPIFYISYIFMGFDFFFQSTYRYVGLCYKCEQPRELRKSGTVDGRREGCVWEGYLRPPTLWESGVWPPEHV